MRLYSVHQSFPGDVSVNTPKSSMSIDSVKLTREPQNGKKWVNSGQNFQMEGGVVGGSTSLHFEIWVVKYHQLGKNYHIFPFFVSAGLCPLLHCHSEKIVCKIF